MIKFLKNSDKGNIFKAANTKELITDVLLEKKCNPEDSGMHLKVLKNNVNPEF